MVVSSTGDCLISAKNITISGSSLSLIHTNNHYLISVPNKPGTIALTNDIPVSPFSKIARVDSSTSITLGIGESCVLYPLATTSSIGFKLSRGGSYTYVAAGTVIQNTSYATSIKSGTGLMRGYDVGSYYRCYYGTSTYTYSVTSYQNGVGIDTWSTPADLYTSVPCLACVLKKSV